MKVNSAEQSGPRTEAVRRALRQVNDAAITGFLESGFSRVVAKQQHPRPARESGRCRKGFFA